MCFSPLTKEHVLSDWHCVCCLIEVIYVFSFPVSNPLYPPRAGRRAIILQISFPHAMLQVNLVYPISFFVICGFLVVLPVYVTPMLVAVDLLILLIGVIVYLLFIRWRRKPAAVQKFLRK